MKQTTIKLVNGIEIPQFGLGVFQIPDGQATVDVVKTALELGYRHIDTAHAYQNERGVGKAIKTSGLPREAVWVTSKLWPSDYQDEKAIDKMLARFDLQVIDLVLLHQEVGDWKSGWRLLEKAYQEGKVRSIGISNFEGSRLVEIYDWATIKPQVIQVETHPYAQQTALRDFLAKYQTAIEAWFPLGHGDANLLHEPVFTTLAEHYHKTPAQIVLRWHIQEGTIIFPRSTSRQHLAENIDIFDFQLTENDMNEIRRLDRNDYYFKRGSIEEEEARYLAWKIED